MYNIILLTRANLFGSLHILNDDIDDDAFHAHFHTQTKCVSAFGKRNWYKKQWSRQSQFFMERFMQYSLFLKQ